MNDNIFLHTNITNLNINTQYDYIKLLFINSCKYFTDPHKLFSSNAKYSNIFEKSNINNILKSNNIYKFVNNSIFDNDKSSKLTNNINELNITCSIINKICKDENILNNNTNLLYLTTNINKCPLIELNLLNNDKTEIVLLPSKYNLDNNLSANNLFANNYKNSNGSINGYIKYINDNVFNNLGINKKFDNVILEYTNDIDYIAPGLKFILNGELYLSMILLSILSLSNGGDMILNINSIVNPLISKIISLLTNVFDNVKIHDGLYNNYVICKKLKLTNDEYSNLSELLKYIINNFNTKTNYCDIDTFINTHQKASDKNIYFYYNTNKNDTNDSNRKNKQKGKINDKDNIKILSDLYLDNLPTCNKLFKSNIKCETILNIIDNTINNELNIINNFILEHDLKFDTQIYQFDNQIITKILTYFLR